MLFWLFGVSKMSSLPYKTLLRISVKNSSFLSHTTCSVLFSEYRAKLFARHWHQTGTSHIQQEDDKLNTGYSH